METIDKNQKKKNQIKAFPAKSQENTRNVLVDFV